MLRNWILGIFSIAIWAANYLIYFAPEIREWYRGRRRLARPAARWADPSATMGAMGPLPPAERVRFPPSPGLAKPEAPEADPHDADIIPFPRRFRRPRVG